jgi:hypothetical protein
VNFNTIISEGEMKRLILETEEENPFNYIDINFVAKMSEYILVIL